MLTFKMLEFITKKTLALFYTNLKYLTLFTFNYLFISKNSLISKNMSFAFVSIAHASNCVCLIRY